MLLLAVQVKSDFVEIKISKVKRISVYVAVKCSVVYAPDYEACEQLPGKQLLDVHIYVILRNRLRFAYHATNGVVG